MAKPKTQAVSQVEKMRLKLQEAQEKQKQLKAQFKLDIKTKESAAYTKGVNTGRAEVKKELASVLTGVMKNINTKSKAVSKPKAAAVKVPAKHSRVVKAKTKASDANTAKKRGRPSKAK